MALLPAFIAIMDFDDQACSLKLVRNEHGSLHELSTVHFEYTMRELLAESLDAQYQYLMRVHRQYPEDARAVFSALWNKAASEQTESREKLLGRYYTASDEMEKIRCLQTLLRNCGLNYEALKNPDAKNVMQLVLPVYENLIRTVQYKLLYLFKMLGKQIKNIIHFQGEEVTCLDIMISTEAAAAMLLAEPLTAGDAKTYNRPDAFHLPMCHFVNAVLDLPANKYGEKIQQKISITDEFRSFRIHERSLLEDFPFSASAKNKSAVNESAVKRDARKPRTVDAFIGAFRNDINKYLIELPNGKYALENFLPFHDVTGRTVYLSAVMADPIVRNVLAAELLTIWTNVSEENSNVEDPEMLFLLYSLKMMGVALETYLRK